MSRTPTRTERRAAAAVIEAMEPRRMFTVIDGPLPPLPWWPTAPTTDPLTSTQIASAAPLGVVNNLTHRRDDSVSAAEPHDVFSFRVTKATRVQVRLTGLTADADLWLFRADGTSIGASGNWRTDSESITRRLPAGRYYVRVDSYGGATVNYRVSVRKPPAAAATP